MYKTEERERVVLRVGARVVGGGGDDEADLGEVVVVSHPKWFDQERDKVADARA